LALNIRNLETERLASRLAKLTGESKTEAVPQALGDRLAKVTRDPPGPRLADDPGAIAPPCPAAYSSPGMFNHFQGVLNRSFRTLP